MLRGRCVEASANKEEVAFSDTLWRVVLVASGCGFATKTCISGTMILFLRKVTVLGKKFYQL